MSINALSLPIDIPWKRLCVSEDMIDRRVCDRKFPYRWRSSVAVFAYEPPEEHQNYEGMIVSYLKIAATITGFQPDPKEVGIENRRIDSYWNDPAVIENFKDIVSKYYGAYGAVLEVSIGPGGRTGHTADVPSSKIPYFADYEPKKREVYELVSETGETMSRSLENVNVRKGTTTSESHEVVDIFGGVSTEFTYAGTGGGGSVSGQWGTRDVSQEEYQNIRTTDQARELRETFSHTTQLTQMYHQLSSYHLGTNRAVFFVLPRPHIVQTETGFVNGPRLLEGIQEFFLVVMRPEDVKGYCVDAYLETAHIVSAPIYEYETSTGRISLNISKEAEDRDCWNCFGDDSNTTYKEDSETYTPPGGWEVDLDRDGGYKIETQDGVRIEAVNVTAERDHVTAYGKVSAWFEDGWPSNHKHNGYLNLVVTVYIRKKTPKISGYDQNLWLTGRGVCCCEGATPPPPFRIPEGIVWEKPIAPHLKIPIGASHGMSIREANELRAEVGREILTSLNDVDRYPRGEVGFMQAAFVGRQLARLIRREGHPDNQVLSDIRGLDPEVLKKVAVAAPRISRGKLLQMPLQEQIDRFELSHEQTAELRRAALGLSGPEPAPRDRWERPGAAVGTRTMPNVVGLRLAAAEASLRAADLRVGDVRTHDDERPRGTVLDQRPEAGTALPARSDVSLIVSSGAEVQIPDIEGRPLTEALCMLRDAGLEREPDLVYVADDRIPERHVVDVTPEPRHYVTPRAVVMVQVSSGNRSMKHV